MYSSVVTDMAGVLRNRGSKEHTDDQDKIMATTPSQCPPVWMIVALRGGDEFVEMRLHGVMLERLQEGVQCETREIEKRIVLKVKVPRWTDLRSKL